jgi:transcriptional regulator with XRE-family HTH domain
MSFAAKLKQLRAEAGLSQPQLAALAGMHRLGVAKLEQGLREPSWATVQALAEALDVDLTAFQDAVKKAAAQPPKDVAGLYEKAAPLLDDLDYWGRQSQMRILPHEIKNIALRLRRLFNIALGTSADGGKKKK